MKTFGNILKQDQAYLWIAAILLFGSSVLGYLFHDAVQPLVENALKQLQGVVEDIQQDPTYWNIFLTIFLNNLRASFIMIVSGFIFGLFPIFSMLLNGFMLGYVMYDSAAQFDLNPLVLFIQQILPHGILEFPAVIIAAGFGIKFGWLVIRGIGSIWSEDTRIRVGKEFRRSFVQLPLVFLGIVILLVLAATIEAGLIFILQDQVS